MKFLIALSTGLLGLVLALPAARANEEANDLRPGNLCYGEYYGRYSNGVDAVFDLHGNWIEVRLNGFVFKGPMNCRSRGFDGTLNFRVRSAAIPGLVTGRGTISMERDGRAHLGVRQNNGLLFSGAR